MKLIFLLFWLGTAIIQCEISPIDNKQQTDEATHVELTKRESTYDQQSQEAGNETLISAERSKRYTSHSTNIGIKRRACASENNGAARCNEESGTAPLPAALTDNSYGGSIRDSGRFRGGLRSRIGLRRTSGMPGIRRKSSWDRTTGQGSSGCSSSNNAPERILASGCDGSGDRIQPAGRPSDSIRSTSCDGTSNKELPSSGCAESASRGQSAAPERLSDRRVPLGPERFDNAPAPRWDQRSGLDGGAQPRTSGCTGSTDRSHHQPTGSYDMIRGTIQPLYDSQATRPITTYDERQQRQQISDYNLGGRALSTEYEVTPTAYAMRNQMSADNLNEGDSQIGYGQNIAQLQPTSYDPANVHRQSMVRPPAQPMPQYVDDERRVHPSEFDRSSSRGSANAYDTGDSHFPTHQTSIPDIYDSQGIGPTSDTNDRAIIVTSQPSGYDRDQQYPWRSSDRQTTQYLPDRSSGYVSPTTTNYGADLYGTSGSDNYRPSETVSYTPPNKDYYVTSAPLSYGAPSTDDYSGHMPNDFTNQTPDYSNIADSYGTSKPISYNAPIASSYRVSGGGIGSAGAYGAPGSNRYDSSSVYSGAGGYNVAPRNADRGTYGRPQELSTGSY